MSLTYLIGLIIVKLANKQDANKTRIWKLAEKDADHVNAWSKGGVTNIKNCEMLCKSHNRAKGNKQTMTNKKTPNG